MNMLNGIKVKKGFTLIELMVVIGVISIVGIVIGPGLKKTYEDFRVWYWNGYNLGIYFQELTGISINGYY